MEKAGEGMGRDKAFQVSLPTLPNDIAFKKGADLKCRLSVFSWDAAWPAELLGHFVPKQIPASAVLCVFQVINVCFRCCTSFFMLSMLDIYPIAIGRQKLSWNEQKREDGIKNEY